MGGGSHKNSVSAIRDIPNHHRLTKPPDNQPPKNEALMYHNENTDRYLRVYVFTAQEEVTPEKAFHKHGRNSRGDDYKPHATL